MSEGQVRLGYDTLRVLIESDRILSPQFLNLTVQVSGAQVELLRNAVEYLTRLSTYVKTYSDTFYTTPNNVDFNDIQTIIADLEEKLMGNGNVVLGYDDRVFEAINDEDVPAGNRTLQMDVVESGYVYFIQSITMRNDNSSVNQTKAVATAGDVMIIDRISPAGAALWYPLLVPDLVLKEGDTVECTFYGCTVGDDLHAKIWGYKMQVPA